MEDGIKPTDPRATRKLVVDVEGNAVVDAEVMVGKTAVYTGANGEFLTQCRRRGWKIVSGAEIEAGEAAIIIIVERR